MRRRRKLFQRDLFDDEPLYSHRQAAIFVGEFFEHLTARMVKGERVQIEERAGDNPDIETSKGEQVESKAAGYSRWLIRQDQLEQFCLRPATSYVLWRYAYQREALIKTCKTKGTLFQHLASSVDFGFRVSASFLPSVVTNNRKYLHADRIYVEVHSRALMALFDKPPAATKVVRKILTPVISLYGLKIMRFHYLTLLDGSKPELPPF